MPPNAVINAARLAVHKYDLKKKAVERERKVKERLAKAEERKKKKEEHTKAKAKAKATPRLKF